MISPLAYIDPNAKIGKEVTVHPFAYIDKNVEIGDNCEIMPYASILSGARLGTGNKVFQGAVIAAVPQDFQYTGDDTVAIVGNDNVIRENVVINRATTKDGKTVIGDNNFLLEGVHVSHDTKIGNSSVFGYGCKLAGNCEIEDHVIFGGGILMGQGCRVGTWAMVQSGSRFLKDIPPYIIASGEPIAYHGINAKVLSYFKFSEKILRHIANAYRLIYQSNTSLYDALLSIEDQVPPSEEIDNIIRFAKESKLGFIK
ncbi:MAG: acyl-ACP--UDP-N-acetylglucosamine O-acyltransferase [Bacteroidales bacterium]|nr:acyl-ACP--UDP-N-acetylglucosamine O-acyltransferase [Bacteroidales bacterium]